MGNTKITSLTGTRSSRKRRIASSLAVTFLLLSLLAGALTSLQGFHSSDSQTLMADGSNNPKPGGG